MGLSRFPSIWGQQATLSRLRFREVGLQDNLGVSTLCQARWRLRLVWEVNAQFWVERKMINQLLAMSLLSRWAQSGRLPVPGGNEFSCSTARTGATKQTLHLSNVEATSFFKCRVSRILTRWEVAVRTRQVDLELGAVSVSRILLK